MIKEQCDFCEKEIIGYTASQVSHLLMVHILSKHKKQIEIIKKEVKDYDNRGRAETSTEKS